MAFVGNAAVIFNYAVAVRGGHDHSGHIPGGKFRLHVAQIGDAIGLGDAVNGDSVIRRIGVHYSPNGWSHGGRQQDAVALACMADGHHHGLGRSCRSVIHRCVAHLHSGQRGHHRLIFENVLQCSLRDLWLIGRVGRQEFRAADHGVYDRWRVMVIEPIAGEADKWLVLVTQPLEILTYLLLAHLLRNFIVAAHDQLLGHIGI